MTLGFVARRLLAEPVGLVFAARVPGEELRHLPELEVRGLLNGDARALLSASVRFAVDRQVRDRILAETRGNPLALLELPRGLTVTQLADGFGMLEGRDLAKRIETSYLRQLEGFPEDARRLLLVAAAEPVGDPLLVRGACERLGISPSAVDATEGLLTLQERVTFRHPLARSAVYRAASGPDRRATHSALAEVTNRTVDPDRRAWHLAAAAAGPDEDVARELELSARRAQARGGRAATAALLQRAVAVTNDPERRAERALAAAQASLGAGAFDVARGLLSVADAGPLDELGRARVVLLRAEIAFAQNRGGDAPLLLLQAARRLEALDVRLCRNTYLDAWGAALFAGHLAAPGGGLLDVSRAVAVAPEPAEGALARDLLLDGLALIFTAGTRTAAPALERAVAAFASSEASVDEVLRWGWLAARAAIWLWDYDGGLEIPRRAVQLARDSGALEVLAVADNVCGQAAAWGGDFELADVMVAEVDAVREATKSRIGPYAAISLAGLRGREAEASELIAAVVEGASAKGQGTAVQYAHWANAVLMNGLGRYEEALVAAVAATRGTPELFVTAWALAELIEAATRTGNTELAAGALARLGEQVHGSDADWALGMLRPLPRAAERRGGRRGLLPAGHRPPLPDAATPPPRTRAPPLRGMAAPRHAPRRRARTAASGARPVLDHRHGGVRRTRPPRAGRHRRAGAGAERRSARRAHPAGAAHRGTGARRAVQPGDRRAALPEPAHRGVAPPQGLRQAPHPLPPGAPPRSPECRLQTGPRLSPHVLGPRVSRSDQ